jgi:hypothetical protein
MRGTGRNKKAKKRKNVAKVPEGTQGFVYVTSWPIILYLAKCNNFHHAFDCSYSCRSIIEILLHKIHVCQSDM